MVVRVKNLMGNNRKKWWKKKEIQQRGVINVASHPKNERQEMLDFVREFWVKFGEAKYDPSDISIARTEVKIEAGVRPTQPPKRHKISFLSIALPDNPFDAELRRLYIRPSYVHIKALLAETDSRRALITGPPGAGVSQFFFFYLKDCLIREKLGLTILTRGFIKEHEYVLFTSSMVFILDSFAEARPYLFSPEVHYLVKPTIGESIPVYPAKTYVIASLTQLSERKFDMNGWATHYIPSWSTIEMEQWLKITLPEDLQASTFYRDRIELFGPTPKNIYDPERDAEIKKEKRQINKLAKRSFTEFKEMDSRLTMMDKDFHLMIALKSEDPTFTTYKLDVCSQEVARKLRQTFDSFTSQEREELARIGEENKDSYLGVLLKGYKAYKALRVRELVRITKKIKPSDVEIKVEEPEPSTKWCNYV